MVATDATPVPGSLLVRVAASDSSWIEQLPHAPSGTSITVTVSHADLRAVPADELVSRGYRIVGDGAVGAGDNGVVDLFLSGTFASAHPDFLEELRDVAARVFDLSFGPVQSLFSPEIAVHLRFSRG